jgi:hypothetical protein
VPGVEQGEHVLLGQERPRVHVPLSIHVRKSKEGHQSR